MIWKGPMCCSLKSCQDLDCQSMNAFCAKVETVQLNLRLQSVGDFTVALHPIVTCVGSLRHALLPIKVIVL